MVNSKRPSLSTILVSSCLFFNTKTIKTTFIKTTTTNKIKRQDNLEQIKKEGIL